MYLNIHSFPILYTIEIVETLNECGRKRGSIWILLKKQTMI
jgi:hypothetical protein